MYQHECPSQRKNIEFSTETDKAILFIFLFYNREKI